MSRTLEDLKVRNEAFADGLSTPQARAYIRQSLFDNASAAKPFRAPDEHRKVMRGVVAAMRGMDNIDRIRAERAKKQAEKPISERGS